jgi:hypothetical protein
MPRRIVVPAKENHKLVAANSEHRTVAEYAAQKRRRRANVFVSGRMALSVVYKLKVVAVAHYKGKVQIVKAVVDVSLNGGFKLPVGGLVFDAGVIAYSIS